MSGLGGPGTLPAPTRAGESRILVEWLLEAREVVVELLTLCGVRGQL